MPHVHAPGLVLQLDPQTLCVEGASFTGNDEVEYSSLQYFVCIASNPKDALWVPLFPGPDAGRKGISAAAKTGHSRWIRYSSFYDPRHLCRIAHKATQLAATAANDDSSPKSPNRMLLPDLPARSEFPEDTAFRVMKGNVAIR